MDPSPTPGRAPVAHEAAPASPGDPLGTDPAGARAVDGSPTERADA